MQTDNRVTKRYLKDKMKTLKDFGIVDKENYDRVYEGLAKFESRRQLDNVCRDMIMNRLK